MRVTQRILMIAALCVSSWSVASASFCTTYFADHGAGVCVTMSQAASGGNNPLSASAVLEVSGGNLDVTIVNDVTGVTNQIGGADVLDAFLFKLTNVPAVTLAPNTAGLTPTLTTTTPNSDPLGTATILNPNSQTINQTWALASGQSDQGFSNLYALTATGLVGPPGGKANFNCGASCAVLGGPSWGIAPASFPSFAPGITPLVQNFAYFTLSGLSGSGLTNSNLLSHLSDFVFQYGTSFSEPALACASCGTGTGTGQGGAVPEPSHIAFLIISSAVVVFVHRRKQRTA